MLLSTSDVQTVFTTEIIYYRSHSYAILCYRYISMLPSIQLSMTITPEDAIQLRHPLESKVVASLPQHPDLVVGFHGDNNLSFDSNQSLSLSKVMQRLTVYPRTQHELAATILLGIATLILSMYFMVLLYRCMCSRNYAKWRASWHRHRKAHRKSSPYYKQIRESVPLILEGHSHVSFDSWLLEMFVFQ